MTANSPTKTTFPANPRAFTGIQPTGLLHLGNLLGAIRPTVRMQSEQEMIVSIVDLHAITVDYQPQQLGPRSLELAATLVACGLDPERCTLFVQSSVPQHTELAWMLNTLTPLGDLQRMTQFKEKKEQVSLLNAGLFNYPILQAADVLLYKATTVPVGEDQRQHLELCREIARRFNTLFGQTFPEPTTQTPKDAARIMALNDPEKKMSKSLPGSTVALTDTDEEITKRIKSAVTDTGPTKTGEMSPGVANLFTLLTAISSADTVARFSADYEGGKLRYVDLKNQLIDDTLALVRPIRERINALLADPKTLEHHLREGTAKATRIAAATMTEVREKMGFL